MKRSNTMISAAAMVAVIATLGIAGISAMAQDSQGQDTQNNEIGDNFFRPRMRMGMLSEAEKEEFKGRWDDKIAEREARREAVDAALKANDYNAWVEAVGADSPMAQEVTEDEFPKLVEAHEYMEEGRALMEEIGFTRGSGRGFGHKFGWHQ